MSLLEDKYSQKDIQAKYFRAKIRANPFDYKISNRVLYTDDSDDFRKYNIFCKTSETERTLADALKLDFTPNYMNLDKCLKLVMESPETLRSQLVSSDFKRRVEDGTFIIYNNLNVFEENLKSIDDLDYLYHSGALEGFECLYTVLTDKQSLIPYLMYLTTEFKDYALSDLEDGKFIKDTIAANKAPIFITRTEFADVENIIENAYLSIFTLDNDYSAYSGIEQCKLFSMYLSSLYLCELLYNINKIIDMYPQILKYFKYCESENLFCKFFYAVNEDHIVINEDLEKCFLNDNNSRFEAFKEFYKTKICSFIDSNKSKINNNFFEIPVGLKQMLRSMHQYAYQQCRVKHLTMLYLKCKVRKIDLSSVFEDNIHNGLSIPGLTGSCEDDNSLLDLSTPTISSDISNDDDVLNQDDSKEAAPTLDALDILKRDLHNSKYEFDINYVKSDISQQSAYNMVAKETNMLCNNLIKQIKEIKVYNTGGKNGGQNRGRLDKKNLWHYKTNPNIFYNNTYKIKEMDLAFGCILDESGSMCGTKIKNGRIVMILLHEVLNSLGINHSIIGHTSNDYHESIINKYYQFKEESHYTLQKPYALSAISSKNSNCDSGALYYMQSTMKQVKNKDKIVIIFSDGQPTECTDSELKEQVKNMEKEGIHVIGVGINFKSIKEYYPDNANGSNLKEMLDIVVSILKRYVLEKKD